MRMSRSSLLALVLLLLSTNLLHAQYLDPGTGSYILQILLAALLASLFYIKQIIAFLKGYYKKRFSKPSPDKKKDE